MKVRKADWISELNIAHALTWRYVIALILVAIFSTAAWLSLHLVVAEQRSTAVEVNLSGRQRMLSQRTALLSNLLVTTPKTERSAIRSKLTDAIQLMEHSHHGLIHGDKEMGLPTTMSPTVHSMYFDGPNALDQQVATYIKIVHELLLLNDDGLSSDNPLLQYITQNASNTLLEALDQMVHQYQLEGEASVDRLQKAETIFWIVTLLLLVLEAALIFHPFVKRVKVIIEKLQGVMAELQQYQGQLEESIKQRTTELQSRTNALTESEEKFRLISAAAKDAVVIFGPEEQVIYWNLAAETIFGYKAKEAIGKHLYTLLTPEQVQGEGNIRFKRFYTPRVGSFIGKTIELQALHKSGKEFSIELSMSAFNFHDNWRVLGIIRDITERKHNEEALKRSESLFRNYFEHGQMGMAITSFDQKWLGVNNRLCEMLGYTSEELYQMTWTELTHPDDLAVDLAQFKKLLSGELESYILDKRFIHKSGQLVYTCLAVSIERNTDGSTEYIIASLMDITERKELEDQVRQLAFYDPLTKLSNRRLLNDRLDLVMSSSKRSGCYLAVLFLDLDNFKPVNDTYGHEAGDLLLIEAASRLKRSVREIDTVARYGGDEFVVILSDLDIDKTAATTQASNIAKKILSTLSEPYLLTISQKDNTTIEHHCTASIGVVVFSNHEESHYAILELADAAMYLAKESGRNSIQFYDLKD